jgi:hypothetical protein
MRSPGQAVPCEEGGALPALSCQVWKRAISVPPNTGLLQAAPTVHAPEELLLLLCMDECASWQKSHWHRYGFKVVLSFIGRRCQMQVRHLPGHPNVIGQVFKVTNQRWGNSYEVHQSAPSRKAARDSCGEQQNSLCLKMRRLPCEQKVDFSGRDMHLPFQRSFCFLRPHI